MIDNKKNKRQEMLEEFLSDPFSDPTFLSPGAKTVTESRRDRLAEGLYFPWEINNFIGKKD